MIYFPYERYKTNSILYSFFLISIFSIYFLVNRSLSSTQN